MADSNPFSMTGMPPWVKYFFNLGLFPAALILIGWLIVSRFQVAVDATRLEIADPNSGLRALHSQVDGEIEEHKRGNMLLQQICLSVARTDDARTNCIIKK